LQDDILTRKQSGFTKGDSAVNQIVNISNEFEKALDSGKEIRVVFFVIICEKFYLSVYILNNIINKKYE
jgi:hypothetical protein